MLRNYILVCIFGIRSARRKGACRSHYTPRRAIESAPKNRRALLNGKIPIWRRWNDHQDFDNHVDTHG